MSTKNGDIVLVTGGSGFIGQHIIKCLLREKDNLGICEIRSVDIVPYVDKIYYTKDNDSILRTFIGDITKPATIADAFKGVDGVFHCAATVKIQYPPNYEELEHNNIDGTRAIVELCVKNNVKRLVFTSCASVCLVPYRGSTFTFVINQTESKAPTPSFDAQHPAAFEKNFLVHGYSASKLRAENIVLNSNGAALQNQQDYLSTVAIRPPLTYGEGDTHFVPNVLEYLSRHSYTYPRIAGAGGKQQVAYAGNVAWGHICAYKTLKASPKAVAGLPVFVTDDTPINDASRFLQRMALLGESYKVKLSLWYLPHFLFFFLAFLTEFFIKLLYPLTKYRLNYSLRALGSFTASVLMFNRLRASIHMDYTPQYDNDTALLQSAKWYAKWWEQNIKSKTRKCKSS